MKKIYRKCLSCGLAGALALTSLSGTGITAHRAEAETVQGVIRVDETDSAQVKVPDAPVHFTEYSSDEMIRRMGIGWNLGNTLDCWEGDTYEVGETQWGNPYTTRAMIEKIHTMGFDTIRIPVTWGAAIREDYSINEAYLARVQQVVDYAVDEGMYVMLNIHHDGCMNAYDKKAEKQKPHGWLALEGTDEEFAGVRAKFKGVWTQIAQRFKNYDEHLIFASMNEVFSEDPRHDGNDQKHNNDNTGWMVQYGSYKDNEEFTGFIQSDYDRIAALEQDFVDVVRASGSNNARRWLAVQPQNTSFYTLMSEDFTYTLPKDPANRLMVEIHDYDGFDLKKSMDENVENSYAQQFSALEEKYVSRGTPVLIGEWGFCGSDSRRTSFEGVAYLLKKYHLVGVVWDNGYYPTPESPKSADRYAIFNRTACEPTDLCAAALLRGFYVDQEAADVVQDAAIVPMTGLEVSEDHVTLTCGESLEVQATVTAPADSNDTVTWKSEDRHVAVVNHGIITARQIGETTVTVSGLNAPGVVRQIRVTVQAAGTDRPSRGLTAAVQSLALTDREACYLQAELTPADTDAWLTYASDNDQVATVSCDGKVMGQDTGTCTITVAASDGTALQVPVTVTGPSEPTQTPGQTQDVAPSATPTILPAPAIQPSAAPAADEPLKKGDTVSVSGAVYRVTDPVKKTVELTGLEKHVAKCTVPDRVTLRGDSYCVTAIGIKAFAGQKTLASVTIGKNVRTIGKKAFYGCASLKKITVRTSVLTRVGAKALGKIHRKCKIRVPAGKRKAYRKLFRGKGQAASVRITK